jgi:hypothetical protein
MAAIDRFRILNPDRLIDPRTASPAETRAVMRRHIWDRRERPQQLREAAETPKVTLSRGWRNGRPIPG